VALRLNSGAAVKWNEGEDVMAYVNVLRGVVGFFEHALIALIGLVLMVVGLALGVTMIMLPVGVVVGLIGFAMFIGGLLVRLDDP
jgi:membrane-bound ClpP family serine protease